VLCGVLPILGIMDVNRAAAVIENYSEFFVTPLASQEFLPRASNQQLIVVPRQSSKLTLPLFYWCATEVETVSASVSIVKNDVPPLTIIVFSFTGAPLNV
jgi:hypothetical protein